MQFYWSYALVLNMYISYDFQCRFDDEKVHEAVKGGDFFFLRISITLLSLVKN